MANALGCTLMTGISKHKFLALFPSVEAFGPAIFKSNLLSPEGMGVRMLPRNFPANDTGKEFCANPFMYATYFLSLSDYRRHPRWGERWRSSLFLGRSQALALGRLPATLTTKTYARVIGVSSMDLLTHCIWLFASRRAEPLCLYAFVFYLA